MRISRFFGLSKSQAELDFIDIDTRRDKFLFIDPFLLSNNKDEWSISVSHTIQSFFQYVLDNIRAGRLTEARVAFRHLNEPNDTCLGMSSGRPQGRGVGHDNADDLFNAIQQSDAVQTGLVEHIQDANLFIENIGRDKISDMTTNIIRKHLIDYTVSQANLWDMPLRENSDSGFFWDSETLDWRNELTSILAVEGRRILLVPKYAVSYFEDYSASTYHQHDALDFLKADHLRRGTQLVKTKVLKDGTIKRSVTKKDLTREELPMRKDMLADFSRRNPSVYESFKERMMAKSKSLSNEEIDGQLNMDTLIDFLISELERIPTGRDSADEYHNLIKGIAELVFYPNLVSPTKEQPINGGRKRIDVMFRNAAKDGFFEELSRHRSCNYVPVECKNYAEDNDLSNPEFDQMIARLSTARGMFGIIAARTAQNPALLLERSRDAFIDGGKIIVYLTDDDLKGILRGIKGGIQHPEYEVLQGKVNEIILR